nr:H-2 class II histocompatibility antigen, A-U alpha chain-like [Nerophis lumbriciformis]
MKFSTSIILMLNCLGTCSKVLFKGDFHTACSPHKASEIVTVNGNEVLYADLIQRELFYTLPTFITLDPSKISGLSYKDVTRSIAVCHHLIDIIQEEIKYPGDVEEPPQTVIYPADELELDKENTMICLIDHFFPPNIEVHWTKNGIVVSEGVTISRYYHNDDVTFHLLSTLTFTPKEGDIYRCTVEHPALDEPKITLFEVQLTYPNIGPDVLCGIGLTVAVFGIAAGVFWGLKGHYARTVF